MGSQPTIYAKTHNHEKQLIYVGSNTNDILCTLKHVVYSYGLQRYPYNEYKTIYIKNGFYKVGSVSMKNNSICVILPSYHVAFLSCEEYPLHGVARRKDAFEAQYKMVSHDVHKIVFTKVDDSSVTH